MTDLNLNLKSNLPEESAKITKGANATGEALVSLDKKVEELDKSFSSFSDGLAKKARPGLEALREATKSTVSELGKQLELLSGSYTELAKAQAKVVTDIEKLNGRLVDSTKKAVSDIAGALAGGAGSLKAAYTGMLNEQAGFVLRSQAEWRVYNDNQDKATAASLKKANDYVVGLNAAYRKAAEAQAAANLGAPSSRITQSSAGLFGAAHVDAAALLRGVASQYGIQTMDMRPWADFQTTSLVKKFVDDLIVESEGIKAGFAKILASTKEGSALALAAMREYYTQQSADLAKLEALDVTRARLLSNRAMMAAPSSSTSRSLQGEQGSLGDLRAYYLSSGATSSYTSTSSEASSRSSTQAAIAASQANIELSKSHLQAASAATSNGVAHTNLNGVMRETHSLARGLAGALGQLWVTYGSILPLLAGAAIAGSVRQMFEAGKELEYQLTFVTQLTGGAAVSTDQFAASMSGAMISTKEGALGLRALAQAGLDAEQALAALPSVMTLSTVGEIGMAQAALAATGIMHAFNLEIGDMGHVVDVMTKAGAISNTSVASMAESMKTASVVADQFHVSLEEMSAGLVILGKRNITGTAAGTALKNIMTELAAPTAKASAKMKQLGIDVYDAEGNLKPFSQQMIEVKKALVGLDEKSKNLALTDMFNERSMKGAAAILKDLDKFIETIDILGNKSQAFADGVVSALGGTVEGQLKMTANAFSLTLDRAFDKTADTWSNLVAKLTTVVSSDGMQGFLVAMSTGITLMIKSVEGFAIMGAALYTYNGVMAISAALEAAQMAALGAKAATQAVVTAETALASAALWEYTAAETAVTAATTAATTATGAAAVATGTLKAVLMSVAWPIAAVTALGTAYYFLRDGANAAAEAEARRGRVAEDVHRQMQERTLQLSQENAARTMAIAQSISYESALLKVKHAATEETKTTLAQAAAQDTLRVARIKAGMAAIAPEDRNGVLGEWGRLQHQLNEAEASLKQSTQHLDNAKRDQERALRDVGAQNDRYSQEGVSKAYYKVGSEIQTLYKDLEERRKNGQKGLEGVMATVKGLETAAQKLGNSVKVGDSVTDATAVNELTKGYKEAKKAADSLATSVGSPAKNAASAAVKLSDAQKLVNAGEKAYGDIMAKETDFAANFTETVLSLVAARDKNNWSSEKYNEVIAAYMAQQPGAIKATKELDKELDLLVKSMDDFTAAAREADAEKAQAKRAIDGYVKGIEESAAALEFELGMMGQSEQSRALAIEQNAIYAESLKKIAEIMADTAWGTDLAARDAAVVAVRVATAIKASTAAGRATLAEWNKTFDTIESGLVSALMTGGKEGGKAARDLIAKMLILEPFEIIVKAYLQPVTTALTSGVTSLMSGGASMAGMGQNLSSMAGAFNGSGLGSFATSSMGASLGLSRTVEAMGPPVIEGGVAPTINTLTPVGEALSSLPIGGILTAYSVGGVEGFVAGVASTAIAGAIGTLGTATSALAGATAAVGAIPVYGWAALGLAAILGMGDDSIASYNTGDSNLTFGADGVLKTSSTENGNSEASAAYALGLQGSYVSAATALGMTLAETNFVTGSNSGKDAADPQVVFASSVNGQSYQSAETQASDKVAVELAASRAVFSALQASEMPKYLAGVFDGITASTATQEEITAALEGANALKIFHDQLQLLPWDSLKDMTYATTKALVDMSGGLEALTTNLSTFYDNFYTDAEKTALLTANTTEAFAALGITMPAVDGGMRDWYRVLVESVLALDQSDAANAGATVAVLALQGAVDTLAPTFDETAQAVEDAEKAMADAAKAMQEWQDRLDVATGKTTERALSLSKDLADAADDQTRALIKQVYAAEDAATAAQTAADAMQSLTDAIQSMAEDTANIIAGMADIGKTDFQKSIAQIKRDGDANQSSLDALVAPATAAAATAAATAAVAATSVTTYSGASYAYTVPAAQNDGSMGGFTAEQNASIKAYVAGLDWSAEGTAASSAALLTAMTEVGVSLEHMSNLGYSTTDLKNVASFATAQINNDYAAANPVMAYMGSNYSNWGGPAADAWSSSSYGYGSGGSATGGTSSGGASTGSISASAAENTAAKINAAYAEQLQSMVDAYKPDTQAVDAMSALTAAGYLIDGLDASGIKKYFYDIASAADPLTEAGKATIDALDALSGQIGLLGQVAADRQAWQNKLDVLTGATTDQALQRQADLASTTDVATLAIIRQVHAQEDLSRVAAERQSWQNKLDVLTGATTDQALQRQADLASTTDAATLMIIKQVHAQEDLAKAAGLLNDKLALQATLYELTGNKALSAATLAAQRAIELDSLDASLRDLTSQIWAAQDAISAMDTAMGAVERAVNAQRTSISDGASAQIDAIRASADANKASIDVAQKSVDSLKGIFDDITSAVKTLRGNVDPVTSMLQARSYIDMSLSLAEYGVMPNADKLKDALGVVTKDSADTYSSGAEFRFAQLAQAGKLDKLNAIVGTQKTTAEQQLESLNNLNTAAADQIKAIEDARDAQLKMLDAQLKEAQDAVDVMKGIDISVLSVSEAIKALNAAINGVSGATGNPAVPVSDRTITPGGGSGGDYAITPKSGVQSAYEASIGLDSRYYNTTAADGKYTFLDGVLYSPNGTAASIGSLSNADALATYQSMYGADNITNMGTGSGYTSEYSNYLKSIEDSIKGIPAFAVGTNYVPHDMVAKIHEGEEIVPKAWNPAAGGRGGQNSERLERLVEGLTKEVQRLQTIVNDGNKQTKRVADNIDNVTEGGNAMRTRTA